MKEWFRKASLALLSWPMLLPANIGSLSATANSSTLDNRLGNKVAKMIHVASTV